MDPESLPSYHRFMDENLFNHVNIPEEPIHIPWGDIPPDEVERHCIEYEHAIEKAGGIDLMLLSIGRSGHVEFNEPGSSRETRPSGAMEADRFPFSPRTCAVYRIPSPVEIDGHLDASEWGAAPWTTDFVDFRGGDVPTPRFRTRAKMLWDDDALYVAVRLAEPDVWGRLTERDTDLFLDQNFEVFIDPTGSSHNDYEVEVNALEPVWDLMLTKPYRDEGGPLDA